MESQNKQIKAYLKKGKSINAIQALEMFGCFRLAARIKDLKESGMVIDKAMIANEEGKHYALYWEVS
tara:strand:+ start:3428 stop:3628 length:201 start_codon:yes stop_codon:yes gene_type:complete